MFFEMDTCRVGQRYCGTCHRHGTTAITVWVVRNTLLVLGAWSLMLDEPKCPSREGIEIRVR